jgi:hypothetical protein
MPLPIRGGALMKWLLSSPCQFPKEQSEGKQAKEEGNFGDHVERFGIIGKKLPKGFLQAPSLLNKKG